MQQQSPPNNLSEFQISCEARLLETLRSKGSDLHSRTIAGLSETYLRAGIQGVNAEVFIYYDGEAQIQGPNHDIRLEACDFNSSRDLVRALLQAVEALLDFQDSDT